MHSRSLVRTTSAPCVLVISKVGEQPVSHVPPQHQAHEALLREMATWRGGEDFTPQDDVLWQALLRHADHGGSTLDLRECHGKVLGRVPESVMQAFADLTASRQPPLTRMLFRPGRSHLPWWLPHFSQLEMVSAPQLRNSELDVTMLCQLKRVELGRVRWPGVKVLVPNSDVEIDHEFDKDLRVDLKTTPSGECCLTLCWHNFNHSATIAGTLVEIECRHIALTTLEHWASLDWKHCPIDRMDPAVFVWIKSKAQLGARVSLKTDDVCRMLALRPREAFIVGFDMWADFLEKPRERLLAHGSPVFAMLSTTTHEVPVAFALAADKSVVVVALDPNFSDKPMFCYPGDGIADLFPRFRECRGSYFARSGKVADATAFVKITFVDDPARPLHSAAPKRGHVNWAFAGLPTSWHAELVREFIVTGSDEGLSMLTDQIELGASLPPHVIHALVQGRERTIGVPWIHRAAQAGQKHVMTAWGTCLAAASNKGLITSADVLFALNLQHMGSTLLSCAIESNHSGFVQCFADVLLRLVQAKVIKAKDVYDLLSLNHRADANFMHLIRSRKMARSLQKAWGRLHAAGALSDGGYEHLQDSLQKVSWKRRLL